MTESNTSDKFEKNINIKGLHIDNKIIFNLNKNLDKSNLINNNKDVNNISDKNINHMVYINNQNNIQSKKDFKSNQKVKEKINVDNEIKSHKQPIPSIFETHNTLSSNIINIVQKGTSSYEYNNQANTNVNCNYHIFHSMKIVYFISS